MRLPEEYKSLIKSKDQNSYVESVLVSKRALNTVCNEAKCPNRGECYKNGTATFLVMGDICTRNCAFCNVKKGAPRKIDGREREELIEAIEEMDLKYVVITSVTRDDLTDGGAEYLNSIADDIKKRIRGVKVEMLIPDLAKKPENLKLFSTSSIDVLNHNLETVRRLYSTVRPYADYDVSLEILSLAKKMGFTVKTGIMTGVGERREELFSLFDDAASAGVDIITIGQYFRPGADNMEVSKYYTADEFELLKKAALKSGIKKAVSGIFVRSSYNAYETYMGVD